MKIKDEAHFNEVIKNNPKVIVDFYTDWCGPCKALGTMLSQYSGASLIVKVDCDTMSDLAQLYNVRSIPYVVKFENGVQTDSFVGLPTKLKLEEFLK